MDFKKRMKGKRNKLGMTLEDVAKVVGVSRQTIQKYESGIVANIPSDKIELLAKALHTTPAYLIKNCKNLPCRQQYRQHKIFCFHAHLTHNISAEIKKPRNPHRKARLH